MKRLLGFFLALAFFLPGKAMADYRDRLRDEYANRIPGRVRYAKAFYEKYGPWLHKYSGGMPVGFMAAIAQWESNGKMSSSGDPRLGEVGFFQLSDSSINRYKLSSDPRSKPEGNIFLAGVEYNDYAASLKADFPHLFELGSKDNWMMARLAFAIGYYGTQTVIRKARPRYGRVWRDVAAWADRTGAVGFGAYQSAGKVWFRIKNIDVQWKVGLQVEQSWYGVPQYVPKYVDYTIPKKGRKYMTSPVVVPIVVGLLSAAGLLL